MLDFLISNDWIGFVLAGFASNGFITRLVTLTPTLKDDAVVGILGRILVSVTGTNGLVKKD